MTRGPPGEIRAERRLEQSQSLAVWVWLIIWIGEFVARYDQGYATQHQKCHGQSTMYMLACSRLDECRLGVPRDLDPFRMMRLKTTASPCLVNDGTCSCSASSWEGLERWGCRLMTGSDGPPAVTSGLASLARFRSQMRSSVLPHWSPLWRCPCLTSPYGSSQRLRASSSGSSDPRLADSADGHDRGI